MFVRGGYVLSGNLLYRAGNEGDYWSSISADSSYAYGLYFDSDYVNPSTKLSRFYVQSLRCVVLGD